MLWQTYVARGGQMTVVKVEAHTAEDQGLADGQCASQEEIDFLTGCATDSRRTRCFRIFLWSPAAPPRCVRAVHCIWRRHHLEDAPLYGGARASVGALR